LPDSARRLTRKLPANLQELVKQNFKKIVPSVEYFDEEKFEGGRKKKKNPVVAASSKKGEPKQQIESQNEEPENESPVVAAVVAASEEKPGKEDAPLAASQEAEISIAAKSKTGKRKPATSSTPSSSKKSKSTVSTIKTKSGTFKVTDLS